MHGAFLRSDYYEASAPPADLSRQRACPPSPDRLSGEKGDRRWFPRSPCADRPGRRPATTPAASPHLRRRLSAWPPHRQLETGFGVDHTPRRVVTHCFPGPYPPDLSPVTRLTGLYTGSSSYASWPCLPDPARLAVPHRPGVVRAASHPPRRSPDQTALSFYPAAATARRWGSRTPTRSHGASWRTQPFFRSNGATKPRIYANADSRGSTRENR